MRYITQAKHLKGKIVLVRADLNSNIVHGKVFGGERLKESAQTIRLLKNKGARVVVIAHQGRPGQKDCVSLRAHARLLSKFTKIQFVADLFGERAEKEIKHLKNGQAVLLENVRMYAEEYIFGKNTMVECLSSWCDYYVNDAFSVSHRKQASIVSLPKTMKKNYVGPLLEKELKALQKIHLGKTLYILGGAKPNDNLLLLGKNNVLACGLFGQMCVISQGKKLGAQEKYLQKAIKEYSKVLQILKKKQNKVIAPIDFGVKVKGKRKDVSLADFPLRYEIFDIGKKTRALFIREIQKARAIYMKGPVGDFSSRGFEKGTFEILRAIANSRAFSVIGGGHLGDAIAKSRISKKKFGHVSLSGGALLEYVAGKKLVGIEVLR